MAQTINTNIASLNAQRNLSSSQNSLSTSLQRLSSGLRVNSARDDAAGLAIAERMNAQVRGMNVAIRNANDAISLSQTAEGSLAAIAENLQRMRELVVQGANATSSNDITSLSNEFAALQAENVRVIAATEFAGTKLLSATATLNFQVGANDVAAEDVIAVNTTQLALTNAGLFADATAAVTQITAIDADIDLVAAQRATFGAAQNRFQSVVQNLQIASENTASARGRIVDADFAQETSNLSRTQILQQAGIAMLAQANALPQSVLTLLR